MQLCKQRHARTPLMACDNRSPSGSTSAGVCQWWVGGWYMSGTDVVVCVDVQGEVQLGMRDAPPPKTCNVGGRGGDTGALVSLGLSCLGTGGGEGRRRGQGEGRRRGRVREGGGAREREGGGAGE